MVKQTSLNLVVGGCVFMFPCQRDFNCPYLPDLDFGFLFMRNLVYSHKFNFLPPFSLSFISFDKF